MSGRGRVLSAWVSERRRGEVWHADDDGSCGRVGWGVSVAACGRWAGGKRFRGCKATGGGECAGGAGGAGRGGRRWNLTDLTRLRDLAAEGAWGGWMAWVGKGWVLALGGDGEKRVERREGHCCPAPKRQVQQWALTLIIGALAVVGSGAIEYSAPYGAVQQYTVRIGFITVGARPSSGPPPAQAC